MSHGLKGAAINMMMKARMEWGASRAGLKSFLSALGAIGVALLALSGCGGGGGGASSPQQQVPPMTGSTPEVPVTPSMTPAGPTAVAADPPSVVINASPGIVDLGAAATLSWSSTNATQCTASGSWSGERAVNGTFVVTPDVGGVDTTYTLTCTGAGGQASDTTQVRANTPLTGRLESVAVFGDDGVPFAGEVVNQSLPMDGAGTALVTESQIIATRGGSPFLHVTAAQTVRRFLIGIGNLSGSQSYYAVDLTRSTAQQITDASGSTSWYEPRLRMLARASAVTQLNATLADSPPEPAGSASYDFSLSFGVGFSENLVPLMVVAEYSDGTRSPAANTQVAINTAAQNSSSLEVTLDWNADVDIDLHVLPPDNGTEIGFDNLSNSGGTLDVDAFPSCTDPPGRVEHVSWGANVAPRHVYRIRPDYFDNCDVTTNVRYKISIRKGDRTQSYVGTFGPGDADANTGGNIDRLIYTAVLDEPSVDSGLISRLLLAEVRNPSSSRYSLEDSLKGMKALRGIIENRKIDPGRFSASGASTQAIITAPGQFDGFSRGISDSIASRVFRVTTPVAGPATMRQFQEFYNAMFGVAEAATADDPFAQTVTINGVAVEPGTWGVRTENSGSPGGNFVLLPAGNIAGQSFYSIKTGVIRRR